MIFDLYLFWQSFEEATVNINLFSAILFWASNLLKGVDFVDAVMMQTRRAKLLLMLTIAK